MAEAKGLDRLRVGVNFQGVLFLLGRLLLALAIALVVPGAWGQFIVQEEARWAFYVSAAMAGTIGIFLERFFHQGDDFAFGRREAFVLVSASWFTAALAGALPYVLFFGPGFAVDAFFESVSGFTTTGASIFADVETLPQSILLWRAVTQWIGGMGIIVLGIAILPKLAIGGMELLGAEAPGPIQEKLTPRIAQTAKALWGIYVLLTVIQIGLLFALGLGPLDAIAHAFATMATGGFSTKNASVAAFGNPAVEWTVTLFMVLAGSSFAVHYQWIRGKVAILWTDPEFRVYVGILAAVSLLMVTDLLLRDVAGSPLDSLRLASFQTVSIMTTTGFATADYDAWPTMARTLIFLVMFVGGCAGSTGGSVKVVRLVIVFKKIAVDVKRMLQPRAVLPVRLGKRGLSEEVVSSVTTFFVLFLFLFVLGGVLLTAMGLDSQTAFSASAACLGNIGPGFGDVGPTMNYAELPYLAKTLLALLMIVGRLELYTVMVIFFFRRVT